MKKNTIFEHSLSKYSNKNSSFQIDKSKSLAEKKTGYYEHMQNFSAYVNKIKQEMSKKLS